MKYRLALALTVSAACILLSSTAWPHGRGGGWAGHHHHGARFGFYVGSPFFFDPFYSWRFGYPYPYYPPTIITVPSQPPVYIEQTPAPTRQYPAGYWYYCDNPQGYYPYVKHCPSGWQPVEPTPPQ
jgi:hypothetical protein